MPNLYRGHLESGIAVDSITITTQPTTTSYMQGDIFDPTGMVVSATAGSLSGDVTQYCTFSPSVLATPGTQTITVNYMGAIATTTVNVTAVTVVIATPPTKTEYDIGDTLDLTGIVVTASYDQTTEDVTSQCTFTPADGSTLTTAGTVTITATYKTMTATTTISVINLVGIAITTPPTKTKYLLDDALDLTGIVVTADYGAFTRDVTSQCTFNPANGTILDTSGQYTLTVGYNGFTATQSYEVIGLDIVTFGGGTDAQLAAMLQAHYDNIIDIHDYWHVGDTRNVNIAAFKCSVSSSPSSTSEIAAHATTYVILHNEGHELSTPINGHTKAAFVIGTRHCETFTVQPQKSGYSATSFFNSTLTTALSEYINAMPSEFRSLIKYCKYTYDERGNTSVHTASARMTYASEKEIFGTCSKTLAALDSYETHFSYYSSDSSRIKNKSGAAAVWMGRTTVRSYTSAPTAFTKVDKTGKISGGCFANSAQNVAPICCI